MILIMNWSGRVLTSSDFVIALLDLIEFVPDVLLVPSAVLLTILACLIEETSNTLCICHVSVDTHAGPLVHASLRFAIGIKLCSIPHEVMSGCIHHTCQLRCVSLDSLMHLVVPPLVLVVVLGGTNEKILDVAPCWHDCLPVAIAREVLDYINI